MFDKLRYQNPQQMLTSPIQQIIEKIIQYSKVEFIKVMQAQFSIHKSINMEHNIERTTT
jgi:hypothetical protein